MISGANWENVPKHVMVGLSGGADSVALLLALRDRGCQVEAAHVNHGLRGEASDGDEAFVRALCEKLRVPLRVYRATPPTNPSEDWARRTRYAYLKQAVEASGAEALALAHHQDDQAETLLMRLLRGTGLTGLTAMAEDAILWDVRVIRPLLGVPRKELRELLIRLDQSWREDGSNQDPGYLRNALRLEVIPRLEAAAPGASKRIAETARLLREDEEALETLAEAFLATQGEGYCISLRALEAQPAGLQRRILRRWWADLEKNPLNRPQTEALLALTTARAGQRCNLPGGWHAQRGWTHLHLLPPEAAASPEPIPAVDGAALCGITLTTEPYDGDPGDGCLTQAVPPDFLSGLELRVWRSGDWIRPFGGPGRKSMQDYFTDRRVDAPFRARIPLLCRGGEALLVCGVGAGDVPRMSEWQRGMLLRWTGVMPWHMNHERKKST